MKRILILQGIRYKLYSLKIVDGSYLRRHRQGHQSVEDGCRIQAQAHADQELVLPMHEALAKCSGPGRRGTLEQIYTGSPEVDPSMQGIKPHNLSALLSPKNSAKSHLAVRAKF